MSSDAPTNAPEAAAPAAAAATPQVDVLAKTDQLTTQHKEREAEMAALRRELDEAKNAAKLYAATVHESARPLFEKYKKHWEEEQKKPMSDAEQRTYFETFTNPLHKDAKDMLMKQLEQAEALRSQAVSVAASLEAAKKELEAAKKERELLAEKLAKATTPEPVGARTAYGRTTDQESLAGDDFANANRREVGVAAGRGAAAAVEEVPVPPPRAEMLPFLKAVGRCVTNPGEVGVVAGANGERLLPMRHSYPAPPVHSQLYDEEGRVRPELADSMRFSHPAAFSFLTTFRDVPTEKLEALTRRIDSKDEYAKQLTLESRFSTE